MQISKWNTPIEHGVLNILSVSWSSWDWYTGSTDAKNHNVCDSDELDSNSLKVVVMHCIHEDESDVIFELNFTGVGAYRLLDENGLSELHEIDVGKANTFKVKGNGWSKESSCSFDMNTQNGWSFMLTTGGECLEVLCQREPTFTKLQTVKEMN